MKHVSFLLILLAGIFVNLGCGSDSEPSWKQREESEKRQEQLNQEREKRKSKGEQRLVNKIAENMVYFKEPKTGNCYTFYRLLIADPEKK